MFRFSTQQLVRPYTRLAFRTASRPAYRTAAFARIAPTSAVAASRFYSSKPPSRRPRNNGVPESGSGKEVKNDATSESSADVGAADKPPLPPLPPGWVHLTEQELTEFTNSIKLISSKPPQYYEELRDDVRAFGAPAELQEILKQRMSGNLTVMGGFKALAQIPRIATTMAERYHEERMRMQGNPNFTSHKPGQDQDQKQQGTHSRGQDEQEHRGANEEQQQQSRQESQQDSGQSQGSQRKGQKEPNQPPSLETSDILIGIGSLAAIYTLFNMFSGESSREITWQELRKNFLDRGLVEKMTVVGDRVRVDLNREATQSLYPDSIAARPGFHYYFSIGSVDAFERRLDEAQQELGIPSTERIPVSYAAPSMISNLVFAFGPTLLLVGLLIFASRRAGGMGAGGGGMFNFSKSRAKMFNHDSAVKVKFADVAGMDEAKVEIMEFVSFLRTPERFQRLGAKIPRGAILSGPPGTGKTLLAKATAGESQVPFFSVSGSEFVDMFVGVGASRVRDLFATARKNAPCIIFIDEIDAIGKSRADGSSFRGGGNDEREATLNQILTEMDGFNTSEQVVVLAGTNRPDILDQALMRPGRFDRHIHIDRPTMKGRQEIFRVHLKKIVTKEDMEYLTGRLAALTPGFAGADIANAVNEAALVGMSPP